MTDHVFADVNRHMATTIMHSNGVSHHLREDGAGAAPGSDDGLLTSIIHLLNFFQEFGAYERPLFE
jgi:hypothetical protein